MAERPIIFSGPMVRAILAGTKTQTRRVLRIQPKNYLPEWPPHYDRASGGAMWGSIRGDHGIDCLYGVPGDRLWVRETHAGDNCCGWVYRADHPNADIRAGDLDDGEQSLRRWTPAIHMKREACRLVLEVTNVRVERLWDISENDAQAEGCRRIGEGSATPPAQGPNKFSVDLGGYSFNQPTAAACFRGLWEAINGESSWSENPWVWAVEFRKAG